MQITFNLYSGSGLESQNTLDVKEFAEFQKIAQSFKQSIKIVSVKN